MTASIPAPASVRPPIRWWGWILVLCVLLVAFLCIVAGPHLWRQAMINNLHKHGVQFYYVDSPPGSTTLLLSWVQKLPGMHEYGTRTQFAEMSVREGLNCQYLPQMMKDLVALDVGLGQLDLTGSKNLIRDTENSQSKIVRRLTIENSEIPAAAVQAMRSMPTLEILHLSGSQLDRLAFQELGALTGLQELLLDQTPITDPDLQALAKLKNLKFLSLSNTEVSETAKAELQQTLPDLQISDD